LKKVAIVVVMTVVVAVELGLAILTCARAVFVWYIAGVRMPRKMGGGGTWRGQRLLTQGGVRESRLLLVVGQILRHLLMATKRSNAESLRSVDLNDLMSLMHLLQNVRHVGGAHRRQPLTSHHQAPLHPHYHFRSSKMRHFHVVLIYLRMGLICRAHNCM
jgi:hypothetical protein